MNDPMSRKLFKSRDAREKLRGMGGIMASSPELAQTVAKFQTGGMIDEFSGLPPSMTSPVTVPVVPAVPAAGSRFTPEQERILMELGIPPETAANLTPEELDTILNFEDITQPMRERFAEVTPPYESTGPSSVDTFIAETFMPERAEEMRAREAAAGREPPAIARQREAAEEAAAEEAADRTRVAATMEAEAEGADAEKRVLDRLQEARQRAAEELEQQTSDNGSDGADTFNFDTTYEQMLERVGRVMGEGADKNDREKAMANLAMIGLAIAAGQSPDALTNIAQGALSGMQAARAQEAREEDLAREARLTALEMAESAADRASRERIAGMRAGVTGEDPRQEYLYNATFSTTYQALVTDQGMDPAEAVVIARQRAREAAPGAPSARTADTTGVTVPTVGAPGVQLTDTERELLGL